MVKNEVSWVIQGDVRNEMYHVQKFTKLHENDIKWKKTCVHIATCPYCCVHIATMFDPPHFLAKNWGTNVNFSKSCHVIEENSEVRVLHLHQYVKQVDTRQKHPNIPFWIRGVICRTSEMSKNGSKNEADVGSKTGNRQYWRK